MKCQEIKLESGSKVIINYERKKCEKCKKDIFIALTKSKKFIQIELVGLAQWDKHKCKF